MRLRGEFVERSFAHTLETGGGRRSYLRGLEQNRKRAMTLAIGFNLSLLMRAITGCGKPRSGSWCVLLARCVLAELLRAIRDLVQPKPSSESARSIESAAEFRNAA